MIAGSSAVDCFVPCLVHHQSYKWSMQASKLIPNCVCYSHCWGSMKHDVRLHEEMICNCCNTICL